MMLKKRDNTIYIYIYERNVIRYFLSNTFSRTGISEQRAC